MSEALQTLRHGAKQLQQVYKDLQPPAFARRDWKDNVFARQTLGEGVEVELWYLAQHFLLAWHDWHGLYERFPRYFGERERAFPAAWRHLDLHCTTLAASLLRNKELDYLVADCWRTTESIGQERQREIPSVRQVYHAVVENHRRWSLMRDAVSGRLERQSADAAKELPPAGDVWPRCHDLVLQLNDNLRVFCDRLRKYLGPDLLFHLRHYRHANLLLSWLMDGTGGGAGDGRGDGFGYGDGRGGGCGDGWPAPVPPEFGRSALLQLSAERIMIPSIEPYVSQFQNADLRGTASHVLERITTAIAEIGYDEFVQDVVSSDFRGGPDSPVGASAINLIPSSVHGPCHALLVAVSQGDKKALGFPNIMRQVREHLIRCPVTQAVIVLCDHWHRGMLDEHLGDLRAQHDRGVRFLFLMVGQPGRVAAPVAVDLGLAP